MFAIFAQWVGYLVVILMFSGGTVAAAEAVIETAFVNVNVVYPAEKRIEPAQTVIVYDHTIAQVGPTNEVTPGAKAFIIDGEGRYLTPGLVEMHAHVPKAAQGRAYLEDVLFLWVANGITTIRNMNGEPAHLELREQIEQREVLGPRIYTAGPPFQGAKIKTAAETTAMVTAQAEAGYDFLKVHMGLSLSTYNDVVAGADANHIAFAGHVANDIGLWRALEAGQKSIDHLDSYLPALVAVDADTADVKDSLLGLPYTPFVDPARIELVAQATAAAGVWNAPTLTLASNFVGPFDATSIIRGAEYMPPRVVRSWKSIAQGFQKTIDDPDMAQQFLNYRLQLVKALQEAGAGVLLGSDAPQVLNVPGFSTHNELDLLVEAGLTPAQALTAGTVNPAIYFAAEDRFGRIQPGLAADLILVAENPLEDISTLRNPSGVMLQGRWLPVDELNARLATIAARYVE